MPAFVRVEVSIRRHRKVLRLSKLLGIVDERVVVGGLVLLWMAARESAPDGDISGWKASDVAAAAGFDEPDADRLWLALIEAGFLEVPGEGKVLLHDWREHNGQFLKDAERKRLERASKDRTGTYPPRPRTSKDVHGSPCLARADGEERRREEPTDLSDAGASDVSVLTPPTPKRDTGREVDRLDWESGFEEFWAAYPRRANSSRKDALKVWMRLMPKDYSEADDLFNAILEALESSKRAWRSEGTDEAHHPHHATWLNRELWRNNAETPHR